MAVTLNLTDTEGKLWDLTGVNPIGSRFPSQTGQGVLGGTADAYDGGLVLAVGTDLVNSTGTLVNPAAATLDENGREVNTAPVVVAGVAVTRSMLVSNAAISSVGFMRLLDSFTNTTDQAVTILVQIVSDVGSDSATAVVASTSGNTVIDTADHGFVTDEIANQTGGDSSVGFVYGDGVGQGASAARSSFVPGEGLDELTVQFQLTLQPGETQRLLSFAFQNTTAAQGVADLGLFDDNLATLASRGLLAGLSVEEQSQIVNYSAPTLPPGVTVTDASGQGWRIDSATGSVSTLQNTALLSTKVVDDTNSPLASFDVLETSETSQDGQEVTLTYASTETALGDARVTHSLMASPEEGYARYLITIKADSVTGLDLRGDVIGLFVGLGNETLIGARDLATGGFSTSLDISDSGAVFDDSASGTGGTRPSLSAIWGDFTLGNPIDGQDAIKASGNKLQMVNDDLNLAAGASASFLYFLATNPDAGLAFGDLAVLSTPGFRDLAGLSALEVASILNFDLTEADRLQQINGSAQGEEVQGHRWGDSITAGAGDDTVYGGDSDDRLNGEAGDDVVYGDEGDDTVDAGGGAADLLFGGTGHDRLVAGAGSDTLYGEGGNDILVGNGIADQMFGGSDDDLADGTDGDDTIQGNTGNDTLFGQSGDDVLRGGLGNDSVEGNAGADTLAGGVGADTLLGGADVDTASYAHSASAVTVSLFAQSGLGGDATGDVLTEIENLEGSAQGDTFFGSDGANVLDGGLGADSIVGNLGNDTLVGGAGADTLEGREDIDLVSYAASGQAVTVDLRDGTGTGGDAEGDVLAEVENVTGSALGDVLTGNGGTNLLTGGLGADRFFGNAKADTLLGGEGADTLEGGAGADSLDGGADLDTASYSLSGLGVTVNLATGLGLGGDAQGDVLQGIENVIGTALNDVLIGDVLANALTGGLLDDSLLGDAGTDTLLGGGGADTLEGGVGADSLNGGASIDLASYANSFAGVRVNLSTGLGLGGDAQGDALASVENLQGSALNDVLIGNGVDNSLAGGFGLDTLSGGTGADTLLGGAGDDELAGGADADSLSGGAGLDLANYAASALAVTVDLASGTGSGGDAQGDVLDGIEVVIGSGLDDALTGDAADNGLNGGFGADTLAGGTGNDTLNGGIGTDRLIGGSGNDVLAGGAGADVFVFNSILRPTNVDTIDAYSVADDVIELDLAAFAGLAAGALAAGSFVANRSGLATLASHRIIYETDTGNIAFDQDGTGAAAGVVFAKITPDLAGFGIDDFIVV